MHAPCGQAHLAARHLVTIRREPSGYGIRFGLTEAEDEVLHGPVFETLPEALAWVDEFDGARSS
ncbi:hypothetical protein DWF00_05540 [Bosea caraganae]|uniref:Uncharacterized protein n=1 Tax=Bosea caraganae TaxID=2763117 RepID=A0A370L2Z7_9HYPH|nr:hypothetical protein DWE98_16785 [Bosea caraganae]RDJ28611.1 hypothetical protein DWF00_05540 [Bosea caraganae]